MESYEKFLYERKEIGSGMAAKVYAYQGFAYKCYAEDYPKEWIDYEYDIQQEIMKSGLPVPHYYESEFPQSIKMDLINGISMYDRLLDAGKDVVMTEMMTWFKKIHQIKGLKLHNILSYMKNKIEQAPVSTAEMKMAMQCIEKVEREVNEPDVLCHMDYHFLNVLYESGDTVIIDWTNAKNGKAIWDYARTYVIFYEYAAGMKTRYLNEVLRCEGYAKNVFMEAVYASAVFRLTEHDTKRVRLLIDKAFEMGF